MKRWQNAPPVVVPPALAGAVGGHPLIAETLVRRGYTDPAAALAFLHPTHYSPPPAADLPDFDRAITVLTDALRTGQTIAVWGDFDVDGQTSTAVLVEGLRALGGQVIYHIPLREDGHGIHLPGLDALIDRGASVLLTCDTGIAAHEAIAHAARRRVTVVITDHHNLPDVLPVGAAALVDPKRLPDPDHPLRTLPGVGVAWLVIEALYAVFGRADAHTFHDLVALGIVADVAEQVGATRWLLQTGLPALTQTARPGLRAILDNAGLAGMELREEQIGFQIGPRLNALGRLGDAALAVELLTTTDEARAVQLAGQLESLNAERRLLTEQVHNAARALLTREPDLLATDVLVIGGAGWHPGVLGIVASRLVEDYDRPAVLLRLDDDGTARGSARSVPGADIGTAIAASADHLTGYGGHSGAAGVRLRIDRIEAFRRAVSRAIRTTFQRHDPVQIIDADVALADLTPAFAAEIERLSPFGAGNPPLTLALRDVTVVSSRSIGRTGDHRLVTVRDATGAEARVLWWGGGGETAPQSRFDLAVSVRSRTYRGQPDVQIEWRAAQTAAGVVVLDRSAITVIDRRADTAQPDSRWPAGCAVWAEGRERPPGSHTRADLPPAPALILWTIPPAYADLRAVVMQIMPGTIYVYAHDPGLDAPRPFLEYLAGMVRYALRTGDADLTLGRLAAAAAHTETTIRAGLHVLAAQGAITFNEGKFQLATGDGVLRSHEYEREAVLLRALLHETALFRRRWQDAPIDALAADIRA